MSNQGNIANIRRLLRDFTIPDVNPSRIDVAGPVTITGELTGYRKAQYITTKVLTAEDSGAVMSPTSAAQIYTLPPAATSSGCHFEFLSGHSSAHKIQTTALAAELFGAYVHNGGLFGSDSDAFRHVEITAGKSLTHIAGSAIGDHLFFYCNGTQWIVEGMTHGALTIAE
jgi:hypothetical protein